MQPAAWSSSHRRAAASTSHHPHGRRTVVHSWAVARGHRCRQGRVVSTIHSSGCPRWCRSPRAPSSRRRPRRVEPRCTTPVRRSDRVSASASRVRDGRVPASPRVEDRRSPTGGPRSLAASARSRPRSDLRPLATPHSGDTGSSHLARSCSDRSLRMSTMKSATDRRTASPGPRLETIGAVRPVISTGRSLRSTPRPPTGYCRRSSAPRTSELGQPGAARPGLRPAPSR